ncbi:sodium/potassium-transporting ATPase subunit beta-1-like [Uranotaenia lowii]|uniref:sodium/potassium-transporting ATPase subunit beta-1-like n=1 Tax=Uranotaenia lowii TaxID=190385 RepID=UPI0024792544|nr:sodium/potassium-transporting ATPase subunit beta-1-like [Uranotaenia lowii]
MPEKSVTKDGRFETTYEFPMKPVKKTFGQFLYDKENNTIMGRTRLGWMKLLIFYVIFYFVLGALTAVCFEGLLSTLSDQYPKYQLEQSLIGTNPGVGFRPMPEDPEQGGMIHYRAKNKTEVKYWVGRVEDFLQPYKNQSLLVTGGKNQVICDFNSPPSAGNVCAVDVSQMGPCTANHGYGFNKSAPCIFIKLNRIYNWLPEFYDDVEDLPDDMPQDLVQHINSLPKVERNQIWVSCNGVNPMDNEAIGPVEYYPGRGIAGYYYPFLNQPGYLSPIVAVQFARPTVQRSINIECRAWAKNIHYRGGYRDRQGSIYFALLVD